MDSIDRYSSCKREADDRQCWHRQRPLRLLSCRNFKSSSAYVLRGLYSALPYVLPLYASQL